MLKGNLSSAADFLKVESVFEIAIVIMGFGDHSECLVISETNGQSFSIGALIICETSI